MAYPESTLLTPKEVITPTSGKRADLGTRGYTMDGRVFHYARANTTKLNKGKVCQSRAVTAPSEGWDLSSGQYWSTESLVTHGSTAYAAGSTNVYLSATCDSALDVTADFFADGWLFVGGATTEAGQLVKIASNTTGSSSGTDDVVNVQFAPGHTFSEVVDTGSDVWMKHNEYDLVEIATSPNTGMLVGVPCCDVTLSYYFWLQTWGPCPVLAGSNVAAGETVIGSTDTDGAADSATASTDLGPSSRDIGKVMQTAGAAADWVLVFLTLAP